MDKKTIFSGMQPSGALTLGNYLGALKNWTSLQETYNCFYCIVDLHSITVRQEPAVLRRQTREVAMQYMAAGLDPVKNTIFVQSHVPEHAELAWILNCYTYIGELSRMTQFKDKAARHSDNINAGLFTYPVLMAADILLYQAHLVPVGEDQRQHLELSRDIAGRLNGLFANLFVVPEPYILKTGARIMSLQEPEKKMSKSDDNPNAVIYLFDEPNVIRNKIKRSVTDSGSEVIFSEDKPGIMNLINIYNAVTGNSVEQTEREFASSGYGHFKNAVADALITSIEPVMKQYHDLSKNKDYVDSVIKANSEKARAVAVKTMRSVKKKIGFLV